MRLIILLAMFSYGLVAQSSLSISKHKSLPDVGHYPKAKIQVNQSSIISADDVYVGQGFVIFENPNTNIVDTLAFNDLLYLSLLEGHRFNEFMTYGFLIGFFPSSVVILSRSNSDLDNTFLNNMVITLAVSAVTGLVAGFIGSTYNRWETYSFMPVISYSSIYEQNQFKLGFQLKI